MRLNRYLASAGLGSRRGVEELINTGQVRINGHVITDLATKVEPGDAVKVGSRLIQAEQKITVVLNKPRGYVCTAADELDRKTIFDLLPANWPRVYHVGRLDKDSEGLLLVTNDGDLSLALTHPRYKMEKEYEVLIDKSFDLRDREKLLRGFHIIGGRAKCERVDVLAPNHLKITLTQGIKRQIRLMLYEVGYEVERLARVRLGPLKLGEMSPGEWRLLTSKEIGALKNPEPAPAPVKRAPRPQGQSTPRPQGANAPRPQGANGPRPQGANGPRPQGANGPRAHAPGPRAPRPAGPRPPRPQSPR